MVLPAFNDFAERVLILGGGDTCSVAHIIFPEERDAFEQWEAKHAIDILGEEALAGQPASLVDLVRASFAQGIADPVIIWSNATNRPVLTLLRSRSPSLEPQGIPSWTRGPFWAVQTQAAPGVGSLAIGPGLSRNLRNVTGRRLAMDEVLRTGRTAWTGMQFAVSAVLLC